MNDNYANLRKWAKDAAGGKTDKIPYLDITDLINEVEKLREAARATPAQPVRDAELYMATELAKLTRFRLDGRHVKEHSNGALVFFDHVQALFAQPLQQPAAECSYLRTPGTHCNKCGEVHGSPLHWTGAIAYTVWQWRKRGEMVWHDADQEVAACGGDEYEYRCLYTKEGVPAHQPSP
jgi:hypothetical protein